MSRLAPVLLLLLAACAAAPRAAPTQEPGFAAFCRSHPHEATCP